MPVPREEATESAQIDAGSEMSHSLLQVSRPYKGRHKVQLPTNDEMHHSNHGARISSSALGASGNARHSELDQSIQEHEVKHHARPDAEGSPGLGLNEKNALSFIQMADSVAENVAKVQDVGSQDVSVGSAHSQVISLGAEEVHIAWRRGFTDAALLASATILGMIYLVSRRCCFQRINKLSQVRPIKTIDLPKQEPQLLATLCGFKDPLLSETQTSFLIPLTHNLETGNSKDFHFKIPRRATQESCITDGPMMSATVTCYPEGSTWAKIQLYGGEGGDLSSPLASCCLVNSTSDVESHNIQGAMMSWLSLLLHEKEGVEAATVTTTPSDESLPQAQVRTSLHGIAEDVFAAGSSGGGSMRLEVRDRLGALAGYLEPGRASKPGRYALRYQENTVFDMEAKSEHDSIAISKQGKVVALATHLSSQRNPEEPPEPTGDEEEHLQVDVRDGAECQELAVLLICTLAAIVFKPKANTNTEHDENEEACIDAQTSPDASTDSEKILDCGSVLATACKKQIVEGADEAPAFYQRSWQPAQTTK